MSEDLAPAIAVLERQLSLAERKVNALKGAINVLYVETGGAPPYPEGGGDDGGGSSKITAIRDDTFYGKKQQTAVREYLEMRKAQGQGPAKPREIFDALKAGGYQFETKDDEIALVSLRALLRKRSAFFHKLPNGAYGLTSWYPHAKAQKAAAVEEEEADDEASEQTTAAAPGGSAAVA